MYTLIVTLYIVQCTQIVLYYTPYTHYTIFIVTLHVYTVYYIPPCPVTPVVIPGVLVPALVEAVTLHIYSV